MSYRPEVKRRQFLVLNSQDRNSGTTNSFIVNMSAPITGVNKCKLVEAIVPKTMYNIILNVNDSVLFNRSSTNYRAQIAPGAYNSNSIVTAIQTAMNALDSNNYVVTFNGTNFLVNISGTSSFTLNWSSNPNAQYGMWRALGWTRTDTGAATSQKAPNVIRLYDPLSLNFNISGIGTAGRTTSSNNVGYTFHVNVPILSGSIQDSTWSEYYHQEVYLGCQGSSFSQLSVNVIDDYGVPIQFNGGEFQLTLQFEQYGN